ARVSEPSSAFGQRAYRASATIRPRTASPRNSSRSLCGAPALRCVSAWASREGVEKTCPANASGARSVGAATGSVEHLGGVEAAHRVEVADQRLADLVDHVDLPSREIGRAHV